MAFYGKKNFRKNYNEEQALRLLQDFKNVVLLGFYNETWSQAAGIIRDMSSVSTPDVISAMGDVLSTQYAFPDTAKVESSIEAIRNMILNK